MANSKASKKKVNAKAPVKTAEQESNIGEVLSRSEEFIEKNKNSIIIAIVALIVIVAGGMLYKSKVVDPKELRVAEYIYPGQNYFMAGDYETALNGDGYDFLGFVDIAKSYGGTKSGNLAKAYAGLCLAQLDSCDAAIDYLKKFKGKDQMVTPSVTAALAHCYANVGQMSKAAGLFVKAANKADNDLLSADFLMQAALIYESEDNKAQALKLFQRIKKEYPASEQGDVIEEYITRVTSK